MIALKSILLLFSVVGTVIYLIIPNSELYLKLNTATPYTYYDEKDKKLKDYKIIFTELVQRHGSRYPTDDTYGRIKMFSDALANCHNCKVKWTNPFKDSDIGLLCDRGREELFHLGVYYAKLFKKLYKKSTLDEYLVRSTNKKRTVESAQYFMAGFYNVVNKKIDNVDEIPSMEKIKKLVNDKEIQNMEIIESDDELLRFHKHCNLYVNTVDNESYTSEFNKYKDSIITDMMDRFKQKTGLKEMNEDIFYGGYHAGQFDYVVNNEKKLLKLFNNQDLKNIEY